MQPYFIGLDLHKKTIAYCMKRFSGEVVDQGTIQAKKNNIVAWAKDLPKPWIGAMEATMFTAWVYDALKPHALELKVANPLMLKAISASKKKNDRVDAAKIADMLRCNLLPECYMAPANIRDLRRALRFRNLLVRESVKMQNSISGILMEAGAEYDKGRVHGKKYFHDLLGRLEDVPPSTKQLLKLSRSGHEMFHQAQKKLIRELKENSIIRDRVKRLMGIPGVGEITALTWVLEIADPHRFSSIRQAVSYCGLCSAQKESAGKSYRSPISKQRNKQLQTILIEAAKLAQRRYPQLAEVYAKEFQKGNRNRATLAVARKLVAYLLAVDKSGLPFELRSPHDMAA